MRHIRNIARWIRRTYKNKIYALALVSVGIPTMIIDHDVTVLVFMLMLGLPLFFSKDNWIMD